MDQEIIHILLLLNKFKEPHFMTSFVRNSQNVEFLYHFISEKIPGYLFTLDFFKIILVPCGQPLLNNIFLFGKLLSVNSRLGTPSVSFLPCCIRGAFCGGLT